MSQKSILINGKIHDWTDVAVTIMGVPVSGITSINWKIDKEKELQYGSGSAPHGVGYGHMKYSCNFELTLAQAQEFEKAAHNVGKDATNYAPFLITVQYAEKKIGEGNVIEQSWDSHTVVLTDVDITSIDAGQADGNKKLTRKYTAIVGRIFFR